MLRLALQRLRYHGFLASAQIAAIAGAIAVTAGVTLAGGGAAEVGYRSVVLAPTTGNLAVVQWRPAGGRADFDLFQQLTESRESRDLGNRLEVVAAYSRTTAFFPWSLNGHPLGRPDAGGATIGAAYFPGIEAHARLTAGTWPTSANAGTASRPTFQASLSALGAEILGVHAGDTYCLNGSSRLAVNEVWCVVVAGIWAEKDQQDPFWRTGPSSFDFLLPEDSYFSVAFISNDTITTAGRAYQPVPDRVHVSDADNLLAGLAQLRSQILLESAQTLQTQLDPEIQTFLTRLAVNAFAAQLVGVALLLVALFAVLYLARHFLEAQHSTLLLWRIRGWRRRDTMALVLAEFMWLGLASLPLGLGFGWLLASAELAVAASAGGGLSLEIAFGALPELALSLGLVAAAIAALVVVSTQRSVLGLRATAADRLTASWWTYRNADLVLGALAIPLLLEARLRGSAQVRAAALGDPLGVMLPGVAVILLALAGLRLLPVFSKLLAKRETSTAAHLASTRMMRRAADHAGLALLLSLAIALGLFASVYSSTERRNIEDRSAYQAGADLRATYVNGATLANLKSDVSTLRGVQAWTAAWRARGSVEQGTYQANVLAVDPAEFGSVAWRRPDLASPDIGSQLQQLARLDQEGIRLEGQPSEASIWINSPGFSGTATAKLVDATGQHCSCSFGSLDFTGWRQLHAAISFQSPPTYPLRFVAISFSKAVRAEETLGLSDLMAGGQLIQAFNDSGGWWYRTDDGTAGGLNLESAKRAVRNGQSVQPMTLPSSLTSVDLMASSVRVKPVPALVSANTLARLGLSTYRPVSVKMGDVYVELTIVGVVDYFPSYYPDDDYFVVPLDQFINEASFPQYATLNPNEAWIDVRGDAAGAATQLRRDSNVQFVEDRQALLSDALHDPVFIQLQSNLAVGFVAAFVLALLGFLVHFVATVRRRASDFAILHANGVPHRLVMRSIAWEQAILVGFSVGLGGVLGSVLAIALLPALQLGSTAHDLVPPTVITVDAPAILVGTGALIAMVAGAGWLVQRLSGAISPLEELRRLG